MSIKGQIAEASSRGYIIRVCREGLEDGWVDAYVAAQGQEFVALEIFDKAARLDGYSCVRLRDISDVVIPAPHTEFLEKALAARSLSRRATFNVDVSALPALLTSAGRAFPLVSICFEGDDDDYCHIGRVTSVGDEDVRLLCITPDSRFESAPTPFLLGGITRVDFGGSYEEALHLVVGGD